MAADRGECRTRRTARVDRGDTGGCRSSNGRCGDGLHGRGAGAATAEGGDGPGRRLCRGAGARGPAGLRRRGRQQHRARLPQPVRTGLPRRPDQPARRARPRRRSSVRGAPARALEVRRDHLRPGPRRGTGRALHRRRPGCRDRRLPRRPGRTGVRPGSGRPTGAGVLRAHHPVRPRHRAAVAAVGPARLPALPHPCGAPTWTGQHSDEPARGPTRDPQPDRHRHRGRRRGVRARLGSVVRRRRRADHARDLHHLHPRRRLATSASDSPSRRAASPQHCCRGHAPTGD